MNKTAVFAGLGDFYSNDINSTGFSALHFVYNNIAELQQELIGQWKITDAMLDSGASKNDIVAKLIEEIEAASSNDWILFYYTGHASKYFSANNKGINDIVTFCVSYSEKLKYDFLPPLEKFLSEIDYVKIVSLFNQKVPQGHLITILDCCHAFGLVPSLTSQEDFHTIIAASSSNESAFYDDNSLFFKAFRQCWNDPFIQMQDNIQRLMLESGSPSMCEIKVANKFKSFSIT